MSWDEADKKAASIGTFVNLKDGQSVTLAVFGEPSEYEGKYGLRFRLNALIDAAGDTKILEVSPTTFKSISAKRAQLATHAFTYSRTGEGTGTKYSFEPARELTDAEKTTLAAAKPADDGAAPAASGSAPF